MMFASVLGPSRKFSTLAVTSASPTLTPRAGRARSRARASPMARIRIDRFCMAFLLWEPEGFRRPDPIGAPSSGLLQMLS